MRNSVVLLRPDLRSETLTQHHLASHLRRSRNAENNVRPLQSIASDGEIASGDDEKGDEGVRDGGGARVGPGEQLVEEGVVVGELLAAGGGAVGGGARGGQVGEFGLCGVGFCFGFFGYGAGGEGLHGGGGFGGC